MWDVIVIGGGAAGMWAAGTAAARGRRVLVLEKNRKAGVKILMSGGTRCNITHDCGIDGILHAFGTQGRFLKPALYQLPPADVVAEFNRLGVATKIEDSGKVFPVSDRAIDVRNALVRRLENAGAELRTGVAVLQLQRVGEGWSVATGEADLSAAKVLLCCGGLSYAGCGTTGDGYAWAERLGHSIEPTHPALTPLLSPAAWVHALSGITLPDTEVRVLTEDGRKDPRLASRGSFLWTHFGCSGPSPMNVSRFVSMASPGRASLRIDLLPQYGEEELRQRLQSAGKRTAMNLLSELLPRRLSSAVLDCAQVPEEQLLAELSKKARQRLLTNLKQLEIPLSGTRGYPKAEVTAGGVCTQEVNPHTFESRIVAGLYLAGEILDIDGPIGGYNFQAAFSTGHAVGLNV